MDSVSRFMLLLPLILSISITPYQVTAKSAAAAKGAAAAANGAAAAANGAAAAANGAAANGAAAAPTDLITKNCQSAVNQELCVRTLKSDPNSKQADAFGLATITLKHALANATAISNQVKKLLAGTPTPYDKARLTDCNENYESAVENLKDTIAAVQSKGLSDATTWLEAAMTDSETCEDGFEEEPVHKSMLADESAIFQQLCGNALVILNSLARH
ncbi:hypothetical protein FRX31_014731 [Thalictrum thalictroides]|uniref:Pectinesterase inhibitor domain-containing protein n=1 Tax=Thalictrum thalictroides TaxID=46969 RepID=A0A7J6WFN9_THATH|nr:hypothetical protein FRX31_014731 [Thalictrum thalictroides]